MRFNLPPLLLGIAPGIEMERFMVKPILSFNFFSFHE
jgi:hypothetical protein